MTREEANKLKVGDVIYSVLGRNADGSPTRWRVNGSMKTWKREPTWFRLPLKHGLRHFSTLHDENLHTFEPTIEAAKAKWITWRLTGTAVNSWTSL